MTEKKQFICKCGAPFGTLCILSTHIVLMNDVDGGGHGHPVAELKQKDLKQMTFQEIKDDYITAGTEWTTGDQDPARDIIYTYGPCQFECDGEYETIEPNEYGSWTKVCKSCGRHFIHDPDRPVRGASLLNLIVKEGGGPSASTGNH